MKKIIQYSMGMVALLFSLNSQAALVKYEIELGGNAIDASGGMLTLLWDDDTEVFTQFDWTFGSGLAGSLTFDWTTELFGGTQGQFMFEILTGIDTHDVVCNQVGIPCSSSYSGATMVSGDYESAGFAFNLDGGRTYDFTDLSGNQYVGDFGTITSTPVNAPATLLLMLAGAGWFVRRRRT